MRDLLCQNFLKRFNRKLKPSAQTTQSSLLIAKIVGNEIDIFLSNSTLNQKNLKEFEKHLDTILENDPRVSLLIMDE